MCVSFRNEFGSFDYFAVNVILSKAGAGLMEPNPVCSECGFLGLCSLTDLVEPSKTTAVFASVWGTSLG